jgi:hypothetical protein
MKGIIFQEERDTFSYKDCRDIRHMKTVEHSWKWSNTAKGAGVDMNK